MQVLWWSIGESNPWPRQCECRALTRQGHIRPGGIQMTARSPSWNGLVWLNVLIRMCCLLCRRVFCDQMLCPGKCP